MNCLDVTLCCLRFIAVLCALLALGPGRIQCVGDEMIDSSVACEERGKMGWMSLYTSLFSRLKTCMENQSRLLTRSHVMRHESSFAESFLPLVMNRFILRFQMATMLL